MMPGRQTSRTARGWGGAPLPRLGATFVLPLGLLLASVPPAVAAAPDAGRTPLRLCADPTNPPFTSNNPAAPGLYLELGGAIGQKLDRPVEPVWEMTYYGMHALRDTLLAGKCDMDIGLPANVGFMGRKLVFSHPFLDLGYALVTPKDTAPGLAALRGKRVAVQLSTGPQSLLAEHDDITMVTVLSPDEGMHALSDGRADAAFLWGPTASYMNNAALHGAWRVTPIEGTGLQWKVAIGFRAADTALRDQVDQALATLGDTVAALQRKYAFPSGKPMTLAAATPDAAFARIQPMVYVDAGTRLPIIRAAAGDTKTDATTDDQQSDADFVAPNRSDADKNFHAATTPDAAAQGRTIFNGTCNHCHGPDAVQSVHKIDLRLLHHRYGGAMDQVFHYTVTHGRETKGMPNWSGVFTEDDFSKILAFLHSVQTPD